MSSGYVSMEQTRDAARRLGQNAGSVAAGDSVAGGTVYGVDDVAPILDTPTINVRRLIARRYRRALSLADAGDDDRAAKPRYDADARTINAAGGSVEPKPLDWFDHRMLAASIRHCQASYAAAPQIA